MKHIFQRALLSAFLLIIAGNTAVIAAPIYFTYTGSGSGTIDGVSFTNTNFIINASGDTEIRSGILSNNGYAIVHDYATITLEGVGSFEFLIPTRSFVNNYYASVGFSWGEPGFGWDLYNNLNNEIFSTWDMLSSTTLIHDWGELLQWNRNDVLTTGGTLLFDDSRYLWGSFQATVVPLPAAVWLFGSGLIYIFGITVIRKF